MLNDLETIRITARCWCRGCCNRRWARAWKRKAKMDRLRCRFLKREWGKSRGRYRARIAEYVRGVKNLEEIELRVTGLEDDILQGQARIAELEEALRYLLDKGCDCEGCHRARKVLNAD